MPEEPRPVPAAAVPAPPRRVTIERDERVTIDLPFETALPALLKVSRESLTFTEPQETTSL